MTNQETRAQIDEVLRLCRAILSGEPDLISACSRIDELRWELDRDGRRDLYYPFVEFMSSLPLLPTLESRHLWHPSHLAAMEALAAAKADRERARIQEACRALLASYGHAA